MELRIKREGKKYAHIFQVNTFLAFNRFITRRDEGTNGIICISSPFHDWGEGNDCCAIVISPNVRRARLANEFFDAIEGRNRRHPLPVELSNCDPTRVDRIVAYTRVYKGQDRVITDKIERVRNRIKTGRSNLPFFPEVDNRKSNHFSISDNMIVGGGWKRNETKGDENAGKKRASERSLPSPTFAFQFRCFHPSGTNFVSERSREGKSSTHAGKFSSGHGAKTCNTARFV